MTADRRLFLTVSLAAAATTAGLTGCSGSSNAPASQNTPRAPITLPISDVPSGGGVILKDKGFVVAQPTEGNFRAFSAICTHQGCVVTTIEGQEIVCDCHGSRFALADGAVTRGPATAALGAATVSRAGDTLTVSA